MSGAPHDAGGSMHGSVRRRPHSQRLTVVHAILAIVVLIVMLQLWLLTATMNAYLGGDAAVLLPAALASLVCLGLNAGLLCFLYRLEPSPNDDRHAHSR